MPPSVRSIACAYCGGAHATADEVRACWQRSNGVEVAATPSLFADVPEQAPTPAPRFSGRIGRGPDHLGRHVLVAPGAPTPDQWAQAPRVVVDRVDGDVVAELQQRAAERIGCVVEVGITLDALTHESTDDAPHRLGARFTFTGEALAHLVVSNAVDQRDADPRWPLLDQALALGARPVDDGRGDIELPDGERAWLDGGPPRFTAPIDGIAVISRVTIEHGSLRPPVDNATVADLAADQLAAVIHDGGAA
ncbi:MAG TPA: hypothetical protein VMS14_00730, partial [Ilumatobacteraceae bacterium]|nr:hypothetical protein [Ilumatobacteraceae bacterium]